MRIVTSLLAFAACTKAALALTGKFSQNLPLDGPNPTKVGFNLYEPSKVTKNAPLLVLAHPCGGSAANAYRSWPDLLAYADQGGFPVIIPDSPWDGKCWDVGGSGTLKHNGGGDSQGIISMVKYVSNKFGSDMTRIFAVGYSSGAMMTQVLLGSYPDVFAAGAEVAGVPFGCWADPNGAPGKWQDSCAKGKVSKTGAEWAKLVSNAYPGYSGYRPKLQLYHGTSDSVINYNNFGEAIKQWTSVFGISASPVQTVANTPKQDWTKTVYGQGQLEAYSGKGMDHGIPMLVDNVAKFFDLACPAGKTTCFHRGGASASFTPTNSGNTTTSPVTTRPTTTKPATNAPRVTTKRPVTPANNATSAPATTPTGAEATHRPSRRCTKKTH